MASVIGVFSSKDQAEKAVNVMREKGFTNNEISIVAKGKKEGRGAEGDEEGGAAMEMGDQDLTDGTAWGGTLGGVAGLLAGAGALAIPGIGPIVAAGPIAAGLSGAVAGGLAGGLVDYGIPEERGRYYEQRVKEGKILTVVKADRKKVDEAAKLLRDNGASDVEVH
ncbi:MAG: hypothetical protein ACM3TT_10940 [Syntrophothermus sp.]